MARHRRTSNPDYFKVAGGSVEDRDLTEQARRRVTQEGKRPQRKKKSPPPRVDKRAAPAAAPPPPVLPPPPAPARIASPPGRLSSRAARFAWSLYVKLLRAAANRALRRWLPETP